MEELHDMNLPAIPHDHETMSFCDDGNTTQSEASHLSQYALLGHELDVSLDTLLILPRAHQNCLDSTPLFLVEEKVMHMS